MNDDGNWMEATQIYHVPLRLITLVTEFEGLDRCFVTVEGLNKPLDVKRPEHLLVPSIPMNEPQQPQKQEDSSL